MINNVPLYANLICGNEVPVILRKCLKSIKPYVDKILVGYNGNDKDTEDVLKEFGCEYFTQVWENDFAKSRNEVLDRTPMGTYVLWLDSDDELLNGDKLIELGSIAFLQPYINSIGCEWYYTHDKFGNCIASLWRERIVKKDNHRWSKHPLHETLDFTGNPKEEGPCVILDEPKILHHASAEKMGKTAKRNLDIITTQYNKEVADGSLTDKTLFDCARANQGAGELEKSLVLYKKYIARCKSDEEKCITYTIMGDIYKFQKRYKRAEICALRVIVLGSNIPDGYIDLGLCLFSEKKYHPASILLEIGFKFKPLKSFPIDPSKYSIKPMKALAVCYLYNGDYEKSIRCADYVLSKVPDDKTCIDVKQICKESLKEITDNDKSVIL